MIRVKATREGLIGKETACGWIIDKTTHFVALPSRDALHRNVLVRNPANGRMMIAKVLDVGPWNIRDTAYVFQPLTQNLSQTGIDTATATPETSVRPQAETGTDLFGRTTNHAGIDLGEAVFYGLGMTDNAEVEWAFLPDSVTA